MPRVKSGTTTKARHKKVLKAAKGYFGSKHRLYKTAKEQLMHSGKYAFRDRKQKKREFKKLWIIRINAACEMHDMSYSRFIDGLNKAGITINRKMLSEIAISDPKTFSELVKSAKAGLKNPKKIEETPIVKVAKPVVTKKPAKEVMKKEVVDKEPVKKAVKENVAKKITTEKKVIEVKDVTKMTVVELKALAKEKGIAGITTMKKEELINILK